ncbi:hypothetical protein [uncultured Dechloromonas sp.]|uniref:hypothetical protein n=1 Tax=uncultured Dechloromonas sp. TaxID=171719 RepID=UPI0025DB34FC|nr:hypothetical protein [uncultured Dechloromonas sp.]
MFKNRYNAMKSMIAAGAITLSAGVANAAAVDYTAFTGALDYGSLGTALAAGIVALIGISLLIGGGLAFWALSKKGKNVA